MTGPLPANVRALCPSCGLYELRLHRGSYAACFNCGSVVGPTPPISKRDILDLLGVLIGSDPADDREFEVLGNRRVSFPGFELWELLPDFTFANVRQEGGLFGLNRVEAGKGPLFLVPDAPSVLRLRSSGLRAVSVPLHENPPSWQDEELLLWTPHADLFLTTFPTAKVVELPFPLVLWANVRRQEEVWRRRVEEAVALARAGTRAASDAGQVVPGWPEGLTLPPGYLVDGGRIFKKVGPELVVPAQVLIDCLYPGQTNMCRIAVRQHAQWKHAVVPLLDLGRPVRLRAHLASIGTLDQRSVKNLTTYFQEFMAHNRSRIPEEPQTEHLGWQNPLGLPGPFIPSSGLHAEGLVVSSPHVQRALSLVRRRGDKDESLRLLSSLTKRFPVVAFLLAAASASLFLRTLNCPNFIVDLHGPTSTGKTSAMLLVASAFGNPNLCAYEPGVRDGLVFRATRMPTDAELAAYRDLPVFLDDHERVITSRWLGLADGAGGVRSVLVTTGNAPISEHRQALAARSLAVSAVPFPQTVDVDGWLAVAQASYGHLLPLLVESMVEHQKRHVRAYNEALADFQARAHDHPVLRRRSKYAAAVASAAHCLTFLDMRGNVVELLEQAWGTL